MKLLLLSILILTLSSCAKMTLLSKIDDDKKDILKEESFIRYSSNRLIKIQDKSKSKQALVSCHKSDIKKGLRTLKKESLKKNSSLIWNNIGTCYYLKENYIKAEFYFQYSLSISKKEKIKNPLANNNLGLIAIRNRNYYMARDYFNKSLKESPMLLTPLYNLAQLNLEFSQIKKAQSILKKLYNINSNDKDIIASFGTSYLLVGNYQEAISYYEKIDIAAIRRTDIALHYSLALFESKKYEEANEILKVSNRSRSNYINMSRSRLQILINNQIKLIKQRKTNYKEIAQVSTQEKRGQDVSGKK